MTALLERTDGIVLRVAEEDDFDAIIARDEQAFGSAFTPEQREWVRSSFRFDRFAVACDGDALVGLAGSYDFDLTLPGGVAVPIAGTTWVSVAPTHRRRGITRDLLGWVHADAQERGLVAAGLMASEGTIYERFGYGIATRFRAVTIDARSARLHDAVVAESAGTVRLVDPSSSVDEMHDRYARAHARRVGELSRSTQWIRDRLGDMKHPFLALHDDGYALWRVDADWTNDGANHTMRVAEVVAATPAAHRALWATIMSVDLIRTIDVRTAVAFDDPLPWLVEDPRSVSTTAVSDFLWLLPLAVDRLLAARRYRVSDELIVEVRASLTDGDGERWRVSGSPDSATCVAVDDPADLTVTRAGVGSLVLGAISVSELVGGGRARLTDPSALGRFDAFFGWSPMANCTTEF